MTENEAEAIVVLITAANAAEATALAELMVEKRLAACVQILPEMLSIYYWKGEVQRDREVLLLAKSTRARFDELEREVRAMHSYETPEIIALSVSAASEPYLQWLISEAGTIN
jgi:periplasmic divalent cation tolerance protein